MILIIGEKNDLSTYNVVEWLISLKANYFLLTPDIKVDVKICNSKIILFHRDRVIDLTRISKVWYRRGWININSNLNINNKANEYYSLKKEFIAIYEFIIHCIENSNIPFIGKYSHNYINKLEVLNTAKIKGLEIPNTLVTNCKKELTQFLTDHKKIITKPISNVPHVKNDKYIFDFSTKLLVKEDLQQIPIKFEYSLFQEYIEKKIELRVFTLKNNFYTMAIFSQNDDKTRIDFRNYNYIKPNINVPFSLPKIVSNKLRKINSTYEFNGGSYDLILSNKNKYYFLEYNPVGQYGMTSIPCNFNLDYLIAQNLVYEN